VDLERQVVTAYRGETPVFATLASTGRGAAGSEQATPPGTFRVWVKLRSSDMDNLENLEAQTNYAIQAVPWVLYFHRGYGLHGAFWHRAFGRVQSHGCVNLTPSDAERLFEWASPRLPEGWSAAFPTDYEPGTIVRVR
jgi:lipoprotein-anchoring transpeptidase ErfK/SrfK